MRRWAQVGKIIRGNGVYVIITFTLTVIFLAKGYVADFSWMKKADHFSILSLSSMLGGFLFTSLGIMISGLGLERIKRLNRYNFLNSYYKAVDIAIVFNIITVLCAILLLSINKDQINNCLLNVLLFSEQVCLYISVVLFIKCMIQSAQILKIIKKDF